MDLGRRTYVLGACGSVCTGGTTCGNDRDTASSPTSAEGARTALAAARLIYANASSSDAWQMSTTTIPRRGLWAVPCSPCSGRSGSSRSRPAGSRAHGGRGRTDAGGLSCIAWGVLLLGAWIGALARL